MTRKHPHSEGTRCFFFWGQTKCETSVKAIPFRDNLPQIIVESQVHFRPEGKSRRGNWIGKALPKMGNGAWGSFWTEEGSGKFHYRAKNTRFCRFFWSMGKWLFHWGIHELAEMNISHGVNFWPHKKKSVLHHNGTRNRKAELFAQSLLKLSIKYVHRLSHHNFRSRLCPFSKSSKPVSSQFHR